MKPYRCDTCTYWRVVPGMLLTPAPGQSPEPAGHCTVTRPQMVMMPRQQANAVLAHGASPQLSIEQQQFAPLMPASSACADHSEAVEDRWR